MTDLQGCRLKGSHSVCIPSMFASASCREASGTSRPGSGLLPPNPMPNFLTPPPPPPPALWDPPRSLWRVPLVSEALPPTPPPPHPLCPFPFFAKPSFLLSCPGAGPAAEAARASVYNSQTCAAKATVSESTNLG